MEERMNFTILETSTNHTSDSFDVVTKMFVASFNCVFGFPTHFYIMWLIVKGTGGVASEFFNLNFSLCETGICLKSLLVLLSFWFSSCKTLSQILQGLSTTGRPLFQCVICVECYLAVVHPVIFLKYKPLRYRVICCITAWIITLGSCFYCLFFSEFAFAVSEYTWFFLLQFPLFLSIQLFCLVSVLRALKQSGPGERGRERKEENHMKRRAFYLILIIALSVATIYVPYTISGLTVFFIQHHIPALWFTSVFCYVTAGFVQPLLFLSRVGKLPLLKPVKVSRCNVINVT